MSRKVLSREETNKDQRDKIWRWIWTTKVAPKIKYFMCRLVHGIIPTKIGLPENELGCDTQCAIYGRQAEFIKQVLFECELSK